MQKNEITRNFLIAILLLGAGVILPASCNRSFPEADNALKKDYPGDGAGVNDNKKVLYLIIDGAEGRQVDSLNPPNLRALYKNAIYTYIGVSGFNAQDTLLPGAWAGMMTGANSLKTKVVAGFDTADLTNYPSMVTRLMKEKPGIRIAGFAASKMFSDHLLKGAVVNTVTENNDEQVAGNVANALKADSANLIIGQFHSVAQAGDTYGYNHRIPQYAQAIATVDGYIGTIMTALKSRPGYAQENWLVIIASTVNGKINNGKTGQDSTSAFDDSRRNSFTIFYSNRISPDNLGANGVPPTLGYAYYNDSALYYRGFITADAPNYTSGTRVDLPNTNGIYNIYPGDSVTIEFKVKVPEPNQLIPLAANNNAGHWWFPVVASGNINDNKYQGFCVALDIGSNGNILGAFHGNSSANNRKDGTRFADANWHTIVMTLAWPENSTAGYQTMYLDGSITGPDRAQVNLGTSINPGNSICIGYPSFQFNQMGPVLDFMIADFRYWKTYMTPDMVALYACKTDIFPNDPLYGYLITNLKLNDGAGSTIARDLSPSQNNGNIVDFRNSKSWVHFNEVSNAVCPTPNAGYYKSTILGVDLPLQVYQWLGVLPQPSWALDGKYWINGFNDVTVPEI